MYRLTILKTIQSDLRSKYLEERDRLESEVKEDWEEEEMVEAAERMSTLDQLLEATENIFIRDYDKPGDKNTTIIDAKVLEEMTCPVCMNEMQGLIYNCTNGHSICDACLNQSTNCPTCRLDFIKNPPIRNRLAEQLITAFINNA